MEGHGFVRKYANHVLREIGELKSRYGEIDALVQCENRVLDAVRCYKGNQVTVNECMHMILYADDIAQLIRNQLNIKYSMKGR